MLHKHVLPDDRTAALIVVLAALTGALLAHVAIDIAGDYVLAHDSYDGLAHGSRTGTAAIAFGSTCIGIVRLLARAVDDARLGRAAAGRRGRPMQLGAPWPFVAAVVAVCVPALMTMEMLDLVSSGTAADDVADLLGGSVWLGLGITIPCAVLVARAVHAIVKWLFAGIPSLVAYFGRVIVLLERTTRGLHYAERRTFAALRVRRFMFCRHAAKRGPPLLA